LQALVDETSSDRARLDSYLAHLNSRQQQGQDLKSIDLDNIDRGVLLESVVAQHPLTGKRLPVYVTSYVHCDYGTGAIMGVPYHDERDQAFALANDLTMIEVINDGKLVNSQKYNSLEANQAAKAIMDDLSAVNPDNKFANEYRMRDWLVSRQRYWGAPIPAIECGQCGWVAEPNLPILLPEIGQNTELLKTGRPLANVPGFETSPDLKCPCCGGKDVRREIDTLDTFMDSSWYFLRFLE
jgi:leucyl-tRNA synthetase